MGKNKNQKGFNLIELLVVVSIIALLSSALFAGLSRAREFAQDIARVKTAQAIRDAVELYNLENGYYPSNGISKYVGNGNPNYFYQAFNFGPGYNSWNNGLLAEIAPFAKVQKAPAINQSYYDPLDFRSNNWYSYIYVPPDSTYVALLGDGTCVYPG